MSPSAQLAVGITLALFPFALALFTIGWAICYRHKFTTNAGKG